MSKRGPGKTFTMMAAGRSPPPPFYSAPAAVEEKISRVDGKGIWRSFKRNFKTKQLALLDLIDNSLDAAIQCDKAATNAGDDEFKGRLHIYRDTHNHEITGLCILNNSAERIPPLKKCLTTYDSSKVDSGVGQVGANVSNTYF